MRYEQLNLKTVSEDVRVSRNVRMSKGYVHDIHLQLKIGLLQHQ